MVAICVLFSTRLWNLVTCGPSEILDKGEWDDSILTLADNNHPIPTLPTAWTESGVMLFLPADPGLWSDVISRWESITINRLNSQTWSDNKAKLAFVGNLIGETDFDDSSVYSISEGEGDVHQNISIMVQDNPLGRSSFMEIDGTNQCGENKA
ncbi:hypothetical protein Tco_0422168 [Tanacetum coccineum]